MLFLLWLYLSKVPRVGLLVHIGFVIVPLEPGFGHGERPVALVKQNGLNYISSLRLFQAICKVHDLEKRALQLFFALKRSGRAGL